MTELSRDWSERVVAWVERTCAEQGVPVKLSDPVALQRVADILGEARDAREAARKGNRAALPARGRAFTAAIDAQGDPDLKGLVMKTSLIIIAAALAVVAGVSAASAASRPTLAPAAKAGCEFATLPRATPAGQQSLYGHISSIRRKGDHYLLRFDPAWLLSGLTASRASLADTGSADVPNDTYTRDETHKVLTFLVRAHAQVTVLTHATCSTRTTVAKFARSATPSRRFWIQVRIDTVRSIDEQYHP